MDERSSCRSTRTSQTTVETNQHHTYRPHCCRPMPGTFRDSGPSSLDTSTGVRTPNYERATSDKKQTLTSNCPTVIFPSAGRTTQTTE
ncbi:hypothetical protein Taro_003290 [Colocasia esculenta]|uniref:Uncharacterized protein n=1 Tax=Colocasia esculenta TaxID=4460 RepID=A0A843TND2_COLES|nr:hypothetical protein [Colocasia esculenta]